MELAGAPTTAPTTVHVAGWPEQIVYNRESVAVPSGVRDILLDAGSELSLLHDVEAVDGELLVYADPMAWETPGDLEQTEVVFVSGRGTAANLFGKLIPLARLAPDDRMWITTVDDNSFTRVTSERGRPAWSGLARDLEPDLPR